MDSKEGVRTRPQISAEHVFQGHREGGFFDHSEFLMANAPAGEVRKSEPGSVKRQSDGVLFLWRTRETRYLLKLITLLFGGMIVSFTVLVLAQLELGDLSILVRLTFYAQLYFLALFIFILVELFQFYGNDRKYKLFPEKNPLLRMKGWPSKTIKRYGTRIFGIVLFVSVSFVVVYGEFFNRWFLISLKNAEYVFEVGYLFFLCFMLSLTAFITAKGSIDSSKARYSERIQHERFWFFALLPVPWIVLAVILLSAGIALQLGEIVGIAVYFWYLAGLFVFGFLCLVSLVALFNQKIRTSYTTSQIAASSTFLIVIIIPGIIGSVTSILGPMVSIAAMAFFYFRGTLRENGRGLGKYYSAWHKKLQEFKIASEEDVRNGKYDKSFHETGLPTTVRNAYHDLLIAFLVLVVTYFGFIYCIAPEFSILGIAVGLQQINLFLQIDSWFEIIGLSLGVVVFTVISVFRRAKRKAVRVAYCDKCGAKLPEGGKFCEMCGEKVPEA